MAEATFVVGLALATALDFALLGASFAERVGVGPAAVGVGLAGAANGGTSGCGSALAITALLTKRAGPTLHHATAPIRLCAALFSAFA